MNRREFLIRAAVLGGVAATTEPGFSRASYLDAIALTPYPEGPGADPLPADRLWRRLQEDGYLELAERYRKLERGSSEKQYRRKTLLIAWERVPGALWALNLPEFVRPAARRKSAARIASFRWRAAGARDCTCTYELEQPRARLTCRFRSAPNRVDGRLRLELLEAAAWENVVAHACFNHLWAPGFGREVYVLRGGAPSRIDTRDTTDWLKYIPLKEETRYGALLTSPVRPEAEGRFIATVRAGSPPLTVGISSPRAASVSWSPWPCTDMDFGFGDMKPAKSVEVRLRLHFLMGDLAASLPRLRA
jgi:hypothetical protein